MSKNLTIEEIKKLPMWPEMNRYIKEVLSKEMEGVEFDIIPFDTHWEIHVDGKRVAEIGVVKMADDEVPPFIEKIDKTKLN